MKLRPYQENAVTHALQMLEERGNSLIVAGTGAGKTIMMAGAIGRYFKGFRAVKKRSPHILVLVHRTEIHTQNHSKFSLVCPDIATSEITASRKSLKGFIHFGMVQTVVNLLPELEKSKSYFDLIVIDEAHHAAASTYEQIIEWNKSGNPDTELLGVTATPNRGDKMPLIHLFDNFYQITSKFLIDSHYLVRPKFLDLSPTFEGKGVIEKGHLAKNCKNDLSGIALINKLCNDFLSHKEDGKSIIFAPSHEFCERIYDRLKELGRNPAYLGLNLDDVSRKAELEKFEKGDSEELINVDICTEGYDFPPLRNLVDFDTNGTHSQWVQKVGRVLRTEKYGHVLEVFGADIMSGTDIFDIKPYVPYSDSHPDAVGGFSVDAEGHSLTVEISSELSRLVDARDIDALRDVLRGDPRPSYQTDPERIYTMDYYKYKVCFRVEGDMLRVTDITENDDGGDEIYEYMRNHR